MTALNQQQIRALYNLNDNVAFTTIHHKTRAALVRRGLVDDAGRLTDAGRQTIDPQPQPQPDAPTGCACGCACTPRTPVAPVAVRKRRPSVLALATRLVGLVAVLAGVVALVPRWGLRRVACVIAADRRRAGWQWRTRHRGLTGRGARLASRRVAAVALALVAWGVSS